MNHKSGPKPRLTKRAFEPPPEPLEKPDGIRHIIVILSGKGGVGKSTVSANLAVALAQSGEKIGLLDADFVGHSQSYLLGTETSHERIASGEPAECFGVKVASIGFIYPEAHSIIWRGPMISKGIKALLTQTRWGDINHLIVDLPPGTSDAQLTVLRDIPIDGGIIVTTPQDAATAVAERGLLMMLELKKRILGVVENMSNARCPHCNEELDIFGKGAGARLAEKYGVKFLGAVPLDPEINISAQIRQPPILRAPNSPSALVFKNIAVSLRKMLS